MMLRARMYWLLIALNAISVSAAPADDAEFKPLFDGQSLDGWHGNPQLWSVEEGAIVGATDGNIPDNTFLISDGEYANFVLRIKFRLHNHTGNSGVQFRSRELKEGDQQVPFVVAGNQADIASERYMGILYGEKTRGIIADVTPETTAAIEEAVKKDDWNEYVITADGDHIKMELNGVTTVDIQDPDGEKKGVIALQLHRGHNMRISFKDIEIRSLD
jgi:hypothetical protein